MLTTRSRARIVDNVTRMPLVSDKLLATTAATSSRDLRIRDSTPPAPGLVLIFVNRRPAHRVFRADQGPVDLGRLQLAEGTGLDPLLSRTHARFAFDGTSWHVQDLGSRNGTFVDGRRVEGQTAAGPSCVVRIGGSVLLACADVVPFERYGVETRDGIVSGPALRKALDAVVLARKIGMATSVIVVGESGTGKEIAAKTFHASGPKPSAPWVPVNCAAIPAGLAERLLFGSKRGAFSGSTDADGYAQAARDGTLFLDEIAELAGDVQSKLLRLLETHEVLRLGATRYEPLELAVCAASWRDLREEVGCGRFREDLYFRLAQAEVRIPPVRERIEEIPWHVQDVLESVGADRPLCATEGFIEACAARPWPGNVRELRAEVRRAAAQAVAKQSDALTAGDLGALAGRPISGAPPASTASEWPNDAIAAALAAARGNVVGAARQLRVHRNTVRRWLERHRVDAKVFKTKR
jgi:transcriptional regulator with AAA-type ATPase domain